jgi:hypothetical protein
MGQAVQEECQEQVDVWICREHCERWWFSLTLREWIRLLSSSENTIPCIFSSLHFPGILGPTCPKVAVSNYRPMLRNIPEEWRPRVRIVIVFASLLCRLIGTLLPTHFWWETGNHSTLLSFLFFICAQIMLICLQWEQVTVKYISYSQQSLLTLHKIQFALYIIIGSLQYMSGLHTQEMWLISTQCMWRNFFPQ